MVAFESLKNKGKVQLGNPKSGRGGLYTLFITKFKSVQKGFHKGGRNLSWSLVTRVLARRAPTVVNQVHPDCTLLYYVAESAIVRERAR